MLEELQLYNFSSETMRGYFGKPPINSVPTQWQAHRFQYLFQSLQLVEAVRILRYVPNRCRVNT